MATRRFKRPVGGASRSRFRLPTKKIVGWGLTTGAVALLWFAGLILWWSKDLPDPQNIDQGRVTESTKIFDSTGEHILYEIGEAKRTKVSLGQISSYLTQATLAAEDDKFYEHHGIAITGVIRGIILKPLTGQRAQGGSTITQQLIKNSILSPERTLQRKVKEAVLAIELEQRFSKDQILEMYLNSIPYGSRAYGAQAASETFFNTAAGSLSLAQAAYLAALPQAPSYYSPYGSHIEDLEGRQQYILNRMANLGMVTKDQAEAAKKEKIVFQPAREAITAPHFVFYVKELLDEEFGERIVDQGGLRVITTLDIRLQQIAEDTLKKNQERLKKLGASNAALVSINPKNGDILAMAGSIDYFNEDIDGNVNVAIRHRSPGSSIKPFVYAAAFSKGYTPDTILVDAETDFGQGYKPKNYNLKENGPVTMRQALSNSLNIPAVQTLYLAGVKNATKLAHDMGMSSLTDPDRYGLSLVLGGGEVKLLEEVSAYGVFANEGIRFDPRAILKVENKEQKLFDVEDGEVVGREIIPAQITRLVTSVLSDNSARALIFGTNTPLQLGARPVAAKTGTTQDFRDGWTMGYTPSLVTGVWTGNNDNSVMGSRSDGVVTAAPIWNAFMREALNKTPVEQFVAPEPPQAPHDVMRGQMPEIKGKWVAETNTLYTADCPVSLGQPKTFKELHNVLFYLRRENPIGPPPDRAENDGQFDHWESAVSIWRDKHNAETKDKPEEPVYVASLPTPACNIGNPEDIPKVRITSPEDPKVRQSPVTIRAEVESKQPLKEVKFIADGETIASRKPDDPFVASYSFKPTDTGRHAVQVLAITENNLIGQGHINLIVNPDSSAPIVTFLSPKDNSTLTATSFPQAIKISASDPSGITQVDVLFQKEGESRTSRIGRTSTISPLGPNRYEVSWPDSPGPGTYLVYAVAYDKTGNSAQTPSKTIIVE